MSEGKEKKKWVAREKICSPTQEGGIGLQKFQEVQKSLHMKLARNLIARKYLWAQPFRAKYAKNTHISLVASSSGTRTWKMVAKCISDVLQCSH